MIAQEQARGAELTIAVLGGCVGAPLRILLPEGVPYSFGRKYVLRPGRTPLEDAALAARVRRTARAIVEALGIDRAARIDRVHDHGARPARLPRVRRGAARGAALGVRRESRRRRLAPRRAAAPPAARVSARCDAPRPERFFAASTWICA